MLTLKILLYFFFVFPSFMNFKPKIMITHSIRNNIKSIRELKNYTQEYMAEELGITQAGYSKIEKGKTDISLTKISQIASILEITPDMLFQFDTKIFLSNLKESKKQNPFEDASLMVKKLYEDKISLLELLLSKTDSELNRYIKKYGTI